MNPLYQYLTLTGKYDYIEPILAENKKGIIIHMKNDKIILLYDIESSLIDSYIDYYSKCSKHVPSLKLLYIGPDSLCVEMVEGLVAADELIYRLSLGDFHGSINLVRSMGEALRDFHDNLRKCSSKITPASLKRTVNERCQLARRVAQGWELRLVNYVCSRLVNYVYEVQDCERVSGHGDLHLYQIVLGDKVYFLDPGGEPDINDPVCLEYDIASLIRSIEYAVEMSHVIFFEKEYLKKLLVNELFIAYNTSGINLNVLNTLYLARILYEYYYEKTRQTGLEWIPIKALQEYHDIGSTLIERVLSLE